jgi:alkanesulfonate monooxygenase SsuD/methylene tetrahydromethanopterin reductase-like flavin-dependent oxidoreductase (luciferase family)
MAPPSVSVMLRAWDIRTGTTGEMVLNAARLAENIGLDGIIAGDHVTFYGYGNDGLTTLTAAAAVTERIELKTAVYLLPLRHPVPVALQVAMLDQLSMGRFVLGIGVGGEDPHEFWSSGVDPATRGARTNESMQILKQLWTEDHVNFAGKHFQPRNPSGRCRSSSAAAVMPPCAGPGSSVMATPESGNRPSGSRRQG